MDMKDVMKHREPYGTIRGGGWGGGLEKGRKTGKGIALI